mmetsp:Transcript_8304/g.37626  ORF Transcript_8304/g.37626 Transcript_8304/m.37626 type:complete len:247 (-) Transcript_8304:219-959(-)
MEPLFSSPSSNDSARFFPSFRSALSRFAWIDANFLCFSDSIPSRMRRSRASATLSAFSSLASIALRRIASLSSCNRAISISRSAHSASSHSSISRFRSGSDAASDSGGSEASNARFARIFSMCSASAAPAGNPDANVRCRIERSSGPPPSVAFLLASAACLAVCSFRSGTKYSGSYGVVCASDSRYSDCVPTVLLLGALSASMRSRSAEATASAAARRARWRASAAGASAGTWPRGAPGGAGLKPG